MFALSGLLGFILFALDVWAIIRIWKSKEEDFYKAVWVAVVVFMPLFGLLVYALFGPKPKNDTA